MLYVCIDRVEVKKLSSEEVKVGVNSMQDTDKVSLKRYQEQKNFQEHIKKERQKIKWLCQGSGVNSG